MKLDIDKKDWVLVKLGDVVVKKEDNDREQAQKRFDRFLKVEHMDAGSLHIKRWSSQKEGDEINPTFYKIFRKGQVLFPTRNPHLKRTALASFDGICGEKTLTLEAIEDMILPEFLPFLFHSDGFYTHTTSSIVGSTNPHCRWRDVANFEFFLPPKKLQKQLSDLLWSMDEVICKEETLLSSLNAQLQVFERDFFSLTDKDIVKLRDVVEKTLSGGTPSTKEKSFYDGGIIPWITTKILKGDYISDGENFITDEAIKNTAAKVLSAGNIVAGTRVGIGKFSINEVDISFSQDVTGLVVKNEVIDLEFLVYQLNSHVFKSRLQPFARGTTIKGITKDDLLDLRISCPTTTVQNERRVLISSIKASIKSLKLKSISSKSLLSSLINQVF